MLKEIWNDPVWSKVIAGIILACGAGFGTYFLWPTIGHIFKSNEDNTVSYEERRKELRERDSNRQKDVAIEKLSSRLKQFVDPTGLQLLEYGFKALSCTAAIDASDLAPEYRGKQEVALVCGFNDGTMDRHKDNRITIGPLYTPQKSIVVKVPFSKRMADAIEEALLAEENRLAPPKGSSIQGSFSVWFRLVLLPKGTDLTTIQSLVDIVDRGGVVSPFEVTNTQSLLRPAKEEFSSYHRSKSS